MIAAGLLAATWPAAPVGGQPREAATMFAASCLSDGRLGKLVVGDRFIPTSPTLNEAALRSLPRTREAQIRVAQGGGRPYRCIGGLVFRLQQLGYRQITVDTDRPPSR